MTADLDELSTGELRTRAFRVAERQRDFGFFWDLVRHVPASADLASEDASAGNIAGSIAELIEWVNQLLGRDLGDAEPLLRARYIDYLRRHGG